MLSQIAIEEQIANEMYTLYRNAASTFEIDNLLKEFGATIRMYTSSDADGTDPEEFNQKIAMVLHETNIALHKEAMTRLTSSHNPATIEASKETTTTQENIMNSTINIESMTLSQLAELQVAIAARMQELINAPVTQTFEELNDTIIELQAQQKEMAAASNSTVQKEIMKLAAKDYVEDKPKTTRVKKSKVGDAAPKDKPDMAMVEQVAKQVEKNDEQVRKAIAAKAESKPSTKAETPLAAPTSDVSTMKYAELRSYISAATKSSAKAKEIATKVAANRGQKSWATVGRAGYEEIYNLIKA